MYCNEIIDKPGLKNWKITLKVLKQDGCSKEDCDVLPRLALPDTMLQKAEHLYPEKRGGLGKW